MMRSGPCDGDGLAERFAASRTLALGDTDGDTLELPTTAAALTISPIAYHPDVVLHDADGSVSTGRETRERESHSSESCEAARARAQYCRAAVTPRFRVSVVLALGRTLLC